MGISQIVLLRSLHLQSIAPFCCRVSSLLPAKSPRPKSVFAFVRSDLVFHKWTLLGSRSMAGAGTATGFAPIRNQHAFPATKLGYFQDMFVLKASATFLAIIQEGDRSAVILDRTIFHPQGGGQPGDTGSISLLDNEVLFRVVDVRAKNGIVYHYGNFEYSRDACFKKGQEVLIAVDECSRLYNSRLHSAGHLLDACMHNIGLVFEGGKGHHFPDSPFVEYKGIVPASDIERKRAQLEAEANRLVTIGGPVHAVVAPYEKAANLCGGCLPDYIPKESSPRIVTMGGLSVPCGGTHVKNVSEIGNLKVSSIRVKKGVTKVSYTISPDPVTAPA